jgi:aspartyl-tRNA synthetase
LTRAVRASLEASGFIEVETPMLIRATPEGSRDYLVPSRVHAGKFYALPQSPQLLKQILMVSGVDRYYQLARCFRDEDLRSNRQPEFTQVDLEMSFAEPQDVFEVVEKFVQAAFDAVGRSLETPFPRMTHTEALARYGIDKPDLRFGLEIHEVSKQAAGSGFGVFARAVEQGGCVRGLAVPGLAEQITRRRLGELEAMVRAAGAPGLVNIMWRESGLKSPILKHVGEDTCRQLAAAVGAGAGDLALLVAGAEALVRESLGQLRLALAEQQGLVDRTKHRPLWVVEFPLMEFNPDTQRYEASNHPFTAPFEQDRPLLATHPERVRARSYDLVIDGEEMGSGSIRNHRLDVQQEVFEAIGLSREEAEQRFGFFLRALRYGAPPHGGIALGVERMLQVALGESSIREMIAFPKTTAAQCLLTESPTEVGQAQLDELRLQLRPRERGREPA